MATSQVSKDTEQTQLLVDNQDIPSNVTPDTKTDYIPLDTLVLSHLTAVILECIFCLIMAAIVTSIWYFHYNQNHLLLFLFPISLIGCGFIGSILTFLCVNESRSVLTVGAFKTKWWISYAFQYYCIIIVIICIEMCIRYFLGGNVLIVVSNWCGLIGSSSATSLLILDIPYLSLKSLSSNDKTSKYLYVLIALLLQIIQCAVTVIGAPWKVILIQIAVRRVFALIVTHVLSILRYGRQYASYVLSTKQSLEYVILLSAMDNDGVFIETNLKQRVIFGNLLLKIPFVSGESMTAGIVSLMRIMDKLIFMEQIYAFGSPTMVILPQFAYANIAFFRNFVNVDNMSQWMTDTNKCKRYISQFVEGIFPYSKNGVLYDMV